MEKTIRMNDEDIKLKMTAGTLLRYKSQFGTDLITELSKYELSGDNIPTTLMFNLFWAMSKTANDNIPDPIAFLDSFDSIDIELMLTTITELLSNTFNGGNDEKKNKSTSMTKEVNNPTL